MQPLADAIRPQTLDEVAGQKHLLGQGAMLRRIIESGTSANLIFYGPSGTGKTTVAGIIAKQTNKTLYHLNATTASLQDVKDIMADVGTMLAPNGALLYLDEIQYFNKKQQQSLLEYMENGKITLVASTTENPYFYVYNALLSRSTVFEFKPLTAEETVPAVVRALEIVRGQSALPLSWEDDVPAAIAAGCGGDVRKAVNAVELLYQAARPENGQLMLTREDALRHPNWKMGPKIIYSLHSTAPCAMIERGTTTTICSRRCKSPSAAPIRMRRCTIWDGFWWQGICCRLAGGFWSSLQRTSASPIHRPWPSQRLAWMRRCSWDCRRRGFRWLRRRCCWPRRRSPTPPTTPSLPPCRTLRRGRWGIFPGT